MTRYEVAMETVYEMVKKLCYTASYTISKFDTTNLSNGDTRVDFEIERNEKLGSDVYVTHQNGTVYVTPKGSIYHIDYAGKRKPVKNLGSVASGFY